MYYDPRTNVRPEPLTHNPLNALIAPRPIGWIGSISADGEENLAPFSYFNAFSADPVIVGFAPNSKLADGTPKDTLANVRQSGEFTASVVSLDLAKQMNESSRVLDHGDSEFSLTGLTAATSRSVKPPHVAEAKAVLECKVWDIVGLPGMPGGRQSHLVLGEVIGIYIEDDLVVDGKVDILRLRPVARLGYFDYCSVQESFEMLRPD
jgi:flavin reductase (DIM6/NTAB) family NADH-FMN oxidoreductase RutF